MARMKRNIGDLVSGRIGNVVFYERFGVNYVCAAPQRKKGFLVSPVTAYIL